MDLHQEMIAMGDKARAVAGELVSLSGENKNEILITMADEIGNQKEMIKAANQKDLLAGEANGLSRAMLDRLALTDDRINGMITGMIDVSSLNDVIGRVISEKTRPNGLIIKKIRGRYHTDGLYGLCSSTSSSSYWNGIPLNSLSNPA